MGLGRVTLRDIVGGLMRLRTMAGHLLEELNTDLETALLQPLRSIVEGRHAATVAEFEAIAVLWDRLEVLLGTLTSATNLVGQAAEATAERLKCAELPVMS